MWQARFKNGKVIDEFVTLPGGNESTETSFRVVMNDIDNLESLAIVQGTRLFTVNMSDGKFTVTISGISHDFYATSLRTTFEKKLVNIRPVYFVRETVLFAEGVQHLSRALPPSIEFVALGFQANLDGANIKRYLAILPNGMYHIEDK